MLGVQNAPEDYTHGRSLLEARDDAFKVSCGWEHCALVDGDGTVVFGVEPYNATELDVLDLNYREVADRRSALDRRAQKLLALVGEMSIFIR